MKKICNLIGIILLVGLFVLAGCTEGETTGQAVKTNEPIKIGLLLPLSGEAASWGQNAIAGATLAVNEVNARGGINGRRVTFVAEDDTCVGNKGVNSMQKLVNVDQVVGIVGPICSAVGGPALPVAANANVPAIIIGSAPHLTSIGENVFRVYPSDSFLGKAAAEFIYNDQGKRKAAIIYTQNDWGQGMYEVFKRNFEALGGEIVHTAATTQSEKDFRTELTKIQNKDADVLFFPVYPASGIAALKQMREMNLDLPIVGGDTFSAEEMYESEYAQGVYFMVSQVKSPPAFEARLKSVPGFADLQVSIAGPLGYDATRVLLEGIELAGTTEHNAVIGALKATSHNGVSSDLIEFDQVGDLKDVVAEVNIIRNNQPVKFR